MATSAGAMNSSVGVVRKTKVTSNRNAKAKQNSKILACVLLVGVLCLSVVVMSAFAANLNRKNNELQKKNDYIQAEIDSLNTKINDASNINKIEKTATEKYGMVHSESQNCITVGDSKSSGKTNLASAIKDEAYE
ncbi:hypothetical protein [Mogibacterium timidum]|uniref:hypothetical protein n=1 Tax=Mogibacterium timidum TaxID=35519 RepID=UPI0028D69264|nr:hypothetical protein [Mogibacterium timidum]